MKRRDPITASFSRGQIRLFPPFLPLFRKNPNRIPAIFSQIRSPELLTPSFLPVLVINQPRLHFDTGSLAIRDLIFRGYAQIYFRCLPCLAIPPLVSSEAGILIFLTMLCFRKILIKKAFSSLSAEDAICHWVFHAARLGS